MPTCLLINLSIQLKMINEAGITVYGGISNFEMNCKVFFLEFVIDFAKILYKTK